MKPKTEAQRLGARIKARRLKLGLSRMDLAVAIGSTPNNVCSYETGAVTPGLHVAKKIRAALGLGLDEQFPNNTERKESK